MKASKAVILRFPTGRSPNCTSDSNACYVISDGVVYYGVGNDVDWYSCGRNSPGIVNTDIAAFLCYRPERCMMNIFMVVMLKILTGKNSLIWD